RQSIAELSVPSLLFTPPPPPQSTLFPLHDALPILASTTPTPMILTRTTATTSSTTGRIGCASPPRASLPRASPAGSNSRTAECRSEEHTSELQSRGHLVCRLLLEKKNPGLNLNACT